jgi:hypothetical protein
VTPHRRTGNACQGMQRFFFCQIQTLLQFPGFFQTVIQDVP